MKLLAGIKIIFRSQELFHHTGYMRHLTRILLHYGNISNCIHQKTKSKIFPISTWMPHISYSGMTISSKSIPVKLNPLSNSSQAAFVFTSIKTRVLINYSNDGAKNYYMGRSAKGSLFGKNNWTVIQSLPYISAE